MLLKYILTILITHILILPSQANLSNVFEESRQIEDLAKRNLYSSPCVVGLVDKYLEKTTKVGTTVVLSMMLQSNFPQKYYLEALNSFQEIIFMTKRAKVYHYSISKMIKKADMYIIFLSDADEIPTHLEFLKGLATYNPYAKIIGCFLVDMTDEQFFVQRTKATKIFFEMDFFDIFIFGIRPNSSILQSYTMFPYADGNCARKVNDIELIDECEFLAKSENKLLSISEVLELSQNLSNIKYEEYKKFYPKLPNYIRGCEIPVTTSTFEPYVVTSVKSGRIKRGLEVQLLNTTFHEIGANVKFLSQDPRLRYNRRTMDNRTSVYKAILNK